jgi:hypothetical protein
VQEALDAALAVGDFDAANPGHHGTPEERAQPGTAASNRATRPRAASSWTRPPRATRDRAAAAGPRRRLPAGADAGRPAGADAGRPAGADAELSAGRLGLIALRGRLEPSAGNGRSGVANETTAPSARARRGQWSHRCRMRRRHVGAGSRWFAARASLKPSSPRLPPSGGRRATQRQRAIGW